MKILLTGGTGFIGTGLANHLREKGHDLLILTRQDAKIQPHPDLRYVKWQPGNGQDVISEVGDVNAIINLAGESVVNKRWTQAQKARIRDSRVEATQLIVRSIQRAEKKPKVLINASAVGFYGPRGNDSVNERVTAGDGFLADVCKAWEAHAIRAADFGVRVVRLRIGVVLGQGGGALKKMLPPFQMFAGGWLGKGDQWMSWIHMRDMIRLIEFALENDQVEGPMNATAPQPVTNKVFSLVLAQTIKRPCFAPVPPLALKALMGKMADELLLKGQRVIPQRAKDLGFSFQFPDIRTALDDLLVPK